MASYLCAVKDRVDAVSNGESGAAGEVGPDSPLDQRVGLAIDAGCRLISNEDLRKRNEDL